jgi:hypothetical protein
MVSGLVPTLAESTPAESTPALNRVLSIVSLSCFLFAGNASAEVYQKQVELNYQTSNSDSEQSSRQTGVSAKFDYYFAPIFVTGPTTQHGYMQKVSQIGFETNRVRSKTLYQFAYIPQVILPIGNLLLLKTNLTITIAAAKS